MITRFTPYEIQECLFDTKRTNTFMEAINEVVRPGDVVVDAGSGSGVLSLFAARAGAKKVYCIEASQRFIAIIKKNAELNNYQDVLEVIHADATTVTLPEQVDVIISELLSTGLFYEPETEVLNHLRQYLKPNGRIIPQNCTSRVQLISAQRSMYGLYFDYDSRYEKLKEDVALTAYTVFDQPDFYRDEPLDINREVLSKSVRAGTANAIRITTEAQLSASIKAKKSEFLFNPLVIYLDKPLVISEGRTYGIHINYRRSEDTLGTRITVREASAK